MMMKPEGKCLFFNGAYRSGIHWLAERTHLWADELCDSQSDTVDNVDVFSPDSPVVILTRQWR